MGDLRWEASYSETIGLGPQDMDQHTCSSVGRSAKVFGPTHLLLNQMNFGSANKCIMISGGLPEEASPTGGLPQRPPTRGLAEYVSNNERPPTEGV